jgi:GH18 family chitinase
MRRRTALKTLAVTTFPGLGAAGLARGGAGSHDGATANSPEPAANSSEPPIPFRIAGYLPDYRLGEFRLPDDTILTDLILFSAEPTASGHLDLARLKSAPWDRLRRWKTRQRVRLILALGGWGRSANFPEMTGSTAARKRLADELVGFCRERRFDGVDLDWEHPKSAAEEEGYAALLAELSRRLGPEGLLLSVTLAAWQRLAPAAFAAVDHVQVMAYDHPGRHSTLDGAKADLDRLARAGASADKLVLGLPFYARHVTDGSKTRAWRERSDADLDADERDGYFFNGRATIRAKVRLARERRLGGVMIWELGQDAEGDRSLLRTISAEAKAGG